MAIKKIIKKILASSVNRNLSYLQADASSVISNETYIRFDNGKESRKYVTVGKESMISSQFVFESVTGNIVIGNNVQIGGAMMICRSSITIEDDVTMAWGITIYDHNSHSINWEERKNDNRQCYLDYKNHNGNKVVNKDWTNVVSKKIVIKEKAWIGFNVVILKGVTIGEGAVIGACSVVVKDVEPWTVVGGNPAVLIKRLK